MQHTCTYGNAEYFIQCGLDFDLSNMSIYFKGVVQNVDSASYVTFMLLIVSLAHILCLPFHAAPPKFVTVIPTKVNNFVP
jgi:hypothetical protein